MKMEYVISSWDIPSLPIVGSNARFPARRIFCVGRNYKLHIEEGARLRGIAPVFPKLPEFFSKPPTTVIGDDNAFQPDSNRLGCIVGTQNSLEQQG